MNRVAILGDVGGDIESFNRALQSIGVDCENALLPPELSIIQVGDLIRVATGSLRGSHDCLTLATELRVNQPDRWIQLLGNHELAVLGGPRRDSWPDPEETGEAVLRTLLLEAWETGQLYLAAALPQHEVLVTHAGLPLESWEWLGSPTSASLAAQELNAHRAAGIGALSRGGALTGNPYTPSADVVWPEVVHELYAPWVSRGSAPFNQVHGHASPWNWGTRAWWPGTPNAIKAATDVILDKHTTVCTLRDGRQLMCVDWGLSLMDQQGQHWAVLEMNDIVTTDAST